jgi:predicted RNA-binding Zn ribbon-like protein
MTTEEPVAPGELETVRLFVNTLHDELSHEHLDSPDALRAWLAEHGLAARGASVRPADLRRAKEVREAIRDLLFANNGGPLDDGALETLNKAAARARVTPTFEDNDSWRMTPAAGGVDEGLGRLLAIVFRSMSDGTWQRLKACGDDGCRWAFYDKSKNRSGHWCDMTTCGNRAKARAYRERARAASTRPNRSGPLRGT